MKLKDSSLQHLIEDIKRFSGIQRKKPIGKIVRALSKKERLYKDVLLSFGEDAAAIKFGNSENVLLFHTDGMQQEFLDSDPRSAGFFAVLVNIKDILAMGGEPLAMVNVIAYKTTETYERIIEGIKRGVEKFAVPMVGGHIHPFSPSNSLSISIVGKVREEHIMTSEDAKAGEKIIMAIDLKGQITPTWKWGWDTTTMKSREEIARQFTVLKRIARKNLASSCKDISNAGILGSLAMLLESSCKGAAVDIREILKPETITLGDWLKMNPGYGFLLTTKEENASFCLEEFQEVGVSASIVGTVDDTSQLKIVNLEEEKVMFDFSSECIMQ